MQAPYLVGVVGYSTTAFDESRALTYLQDVLLDELQRHPGLVVVSGGTELGVPKLAYQVADALHVPTVGVICTEGRGYELHAVDLLLVEGRTWGDESWLFLNLLDALYRVGGGQQSHAEVGLARELGLPVTEFEP